MLNETGPSMNTCIGNGAVDNADGKHGPSEFLTGDGHGLDRLQGNNTAMAMGEQMKNTQQGRMRMREFASRRSIQFGRFSLSQSLGNDVVSTACGL